VTIATTRPETMLGDTAVAVHPDPAAALDKAEAELRTKLAAAPAKEKDEVQKQVDAIAERRKTMLPLLVTLRDMAKRGVKLELPLTGRTIPLIADEWAKPELGSGAVKVTPAHDANDYAVWQRHPEIGLINIMTVEGTLNDSVPEKYRGLKMHTKAREAVVADMESAGLYNPETDREDREIDLAHSDRSKTPIEPYLADQWFVKMDELSQSAMDAVTDGRVKLTPERYAKGYLDWLGEKRDWPIGRQLWWGHRIPVWHLLWDGPIATEPSDSQIVNLELPFLSPDENSRVVTQVIREGKEDGRIFFGICVRPGHEGIEKKLAAHGADQDPGVLDTWFSSALWPMSTLGWPEETAELKTFYPTSVLITSREIITLWVARMVLAGLYNKGEVPFSRVYITPKILDGYGETMSKSKGNGVDPLDMIEKFGADALRFGIAHLTTETQDVRLPVEFECPHCKAVFPQTKKNRQLPRVPCEKCGQPFGTQWAEKPEDKALARGASVSERFELGRNFCNKLWNASRFSLINLEGFEAGPVEDSDLFPEDRWLLSRLATVTEQVTGLLEQFQYAEAAKALYDFAWNDFCSSYVELTKARFVVPTQRPTAQRVLAHSLDVLLRLLHPMIPFLTEEVWQLLAKAAPLRGLTQPSPPAASVCIAPWPAKQLSLHVNPNQSEMMLRPTETPPTFTASADLEVPAPNMSATARFEAYDARYKSDIVEAQFSDFQALVGAIREARTRQNIPFNQSIPFATGCDQPTADLLSTMTNSFVQLAHAIPLNWGPKVKPSPTSTTTIVPGTNGPMELHLEVSRFIDVGAERKRLAKQRAELTKFIGGGDAKLANKAFVDKAPAEVVQQIRDKRAELREQLASVEAALKKLG
jgi:valyl-tRNA synthetase